jgi:hypothetical protein
MSRHAPLYGVGLDALSMNELETLSRIHEEGLRQLRSLQHQRKGGGEAMVANHHNSLGNVPSPIGVYNSHTVAMGMPPVGSTTNGAGMHGNGHMNGNVGPWYAPT